MKTIIFLFLELILCNLKVIGQENSLSPLLISMEVNYSLKEHDRQEKLKKKQLLNTSTEGANQEQWKSYKKVVEKVQERLRKVDFMLQAIPTGYALTQKYREIRANQRQIVREIRTAPQSIKEVLPNQIKFVDDLQMVIRFLTGIIASYGTMNQMERADRQILLNHALAEVDRLNNNSFATLCVIREAKEQERLKKAMFDYYIERDKELVEDLLKNIKRL
jgi:hypothetical protein